MESNHETSEATSAQRYEEFLELFSRERDRLYAYVYSLVPHAADAEDVFQKCSVVLWRKFGEFDRRRSFLAWACGVASYEVRNFLRVAGRDRLRFDDELVRKLAAERLESLERHEARLAALRTCLRQLTTDQRELLEAAYGGDGTVVQFAESTGRALQTLYNRLGGLRRRLLECIRRRLRAEGEPA